MKMRFKRFLSGFMAVATLASVIVQPVTVSASELEPEPTSFEQQYPELQDVQYASVKVIKRDAKARSPVRISGRVRLVRRR